MSNKRMVHESFFESEDVSEWTIRQRLLVIGIITYADDQGRLRAHPGWLKSRIFPYDDGILPSDIAEDLKNISGTNDTVLIYENEGKQYIQLTNWWEYQNLQWAKPSEYPNPEKWIDRIRMMIYEPNNVRWVFTENWPGSEDNSPPNDDSKELPDLLPNNPGDELVGELAPTTTINTDINPDSIQEEEESPLTPFSELSAAFVNKTQIPEFNGGARKWNEAIKRMVKAGVEPIDVETAVDELLNSKNNYTIVGIQSVENASYSAMAKRKKKPRSAKPDRDPKSYVSGQFAEYIEH